MSAVPSLRGKVALVTGGSRGAGRGIAAVLGEAGATVYVTGRSTRGRGSAEGLPGTVEETAEEVTARGGRGVPVRCDHTDDADVESLFARLRGEQGRLDLLVNNAWGGYERGGPGSDVFWRETLPLWDMMFVAGLRAHIVATRHALPLMLPPEAMAKRPVQGFCRKCGLFVHADEPSDPWPGWPGLLEHRRDCVGEMARVEARALIVHTVAWSYGDLIGGLYDTSKAAIIRFSQNIAREARPWGVAAVAVWPGWMRTERVMAAHAKDPFDLSRTESPEYVGRAVAHLAADRGVMARSGGAFAAGALAREYGFTDVDGTRPPPFRLPWKEAGSAPAGGGEAAGGEEKDDPRKIALRFVERINARDVKGLGDLISEDHRFTDSLGAEVLGREPVRRAWREYFRIVPGYRIEVRDLLARGETVLILGTASGGVRRRGARRPEDPWSTPAAWEARVSGGRVTAWRVFADNEPLRRRMGAPPVRKRAGGGSKKG